VVPLMQTAEDLERISYEFAMDNISEGVRYVEVRFAPQLHINASLDIEQILVSVDRGMKRAQRAYNQQEAVIKGELPQFAYGIIVCAWRYFSKGLCRTLDAFLEAHQHSDPYTIFGLASQELVKACVKVRDKYDLPIVAFDLVGAEAGNLPIHHKEAYHFAHRNFMRCTVHAGEAHGPESIFQAVTELYPDRIGHGFHLFSKDEIDDSNIEDKDLYINRLTQYLAAKDIGIEVCLTSNLQTIPVVKEIKRHSLRKMLDANLKTTICTDNRTMSKTSVTKELLLALQHFDLSSELLREIVYSGFAQSFYPGNGMQKKAYVRQVMDFYDALADQYYRGEHI